MEDTEEKPDSPASSGYEMPSLIELGSVVELTRRSGAVDTTDMQQWYN
ncbi:MAG: lasso RiPP family leader peptide-containing protein [Pseudonocardiaceae bacterium]